MKLCYIDESGDTGTLHGPASAIQPVLVIGAVVIDHAQLIPLTTAFINLKKRFSPNLASRSGHRLSMVLNEMKGNNIRKGVASGNRRESRRAIGFLDKLMDMLEYHKVRVFGRVWVKQFVYPMDALAVFTSSIQSICHTFQQYLEQVRDTGFVIADSRTQNQNISVAHSIFTQKFKITGDPYSKIWEMPTFGHSNNHVGLQIADLIVSAFISPISCHAYCSSHMTNKMHAKPGYKILRERYGDRLKKLQFRYLNSERKWRGGITVSDGLGKQSGALLFGEPFLPRSSNSVLPTTVVASDLSQPIVTSSTMVQTPNSITSPIVQLQNNGAASQI